MSENFDKLATLLDPVLGSDFYANLCKIKDGLKTIQSRFAELVKSPAALIEGEIANSNTLPRTWDCPQEDLLSAGKKIIQRLALTDLDNFSDSLEDAGLLRDVSSVISQMDDYRYRTLKNSVGTALNSALDLNEAFSEMRYENGHLRKKMTSRGTKLIQFASTCKSDLEAMIQVHQLYSSESTSGDITYKDGSDEWQQVKRRRTQSTHEDDINERYIFVSHLAQLRDFPWDCGEFVAKREKLLKSMTETHRHLTESVPNNFAKLAEQDGKIDDRMSEWIDKLTMGDSGSVP